MEQSNETQNESGELETTVKTEAVEQPKRKRPGLTDKQFIDACNAVAMGENPSIEAIAEATGYTAKTVQGRRATINAELRKTHGSDVAPVLIPLPTGGGNRKSAEPLAEDDITAAQAKVAEFLAKRKETKTDA